MAQRLIDADALIEAMTKFSNATGEDMTHGIFYAHIAPTIAAVPLKRGKWTADEILYTQGMTACSCCKTEYYRDDLYMVGNNAQGELPNYCPNCGARMDEE